MAARSFDIQALPSAAMKALYTLLKTSDSLGLLVLRLTLGLVFLPHGLQKTFGLFGGDGFSATMDHMSKGFPAWLVFLAIAAEFAGAIGCILGLFTRVAAFGIGMTMVVAVFAVHAKFGFFMNWHGAVVDMAGKTMAKPEGFEYHLLAIGMAVCLMIRGGGFLSADTAIAGQAGLPGPAHV